MSDIPQWELGGRWIWRGDTRAKTAATARYKNHAVKYRMMIWPDPQWHGYVGILIVSRHHPDGTEEASKIAAFYQAINSIWIEEQLEARLQEIALLPNSSDTL